MVESRPSTIAAMLRRAALIGVLLLPSPALAQYIGGAAPPLPAPLRPGEIQSPAGTLARALRILAQSPRDFTALVSAGRAAVDLGDTQAAIGFFGRAEEVRPSDPAPKIGMGAATVASGDATGAMRWFFEAQRLGATPSALGADRGLAQDLLGNQASAQVDYRAALTGREADEARRRLALSLGISGDRTAAFTALQPLLARRDPGAQRIRAFVLALVGDERGASSAINQAMPGSGSRMEGFFRLLPALSAQQKAAAVHLGIFPDPSEIRVAAVSPRVGSVPSFERRAAPTTSRGAPRIAPYVAPPRTASARATQRPAVKPPPRVIVVDPVPRAATSSFNFRRPSERARVTSPPAAAPAPRIIAAPPPRIIAAPASASTAPVSAGADVAAPKPGFSAADAGVAVGVPFGPPAPTVSETAVPGEPAVVAAAATAPEREVELVAVSQDRLSGIDRLLAQADELPVPPAPRPKVEKPSVASAADTARAKKTAELKKAAEAKKAAQASKAASDKAERESIGLAGTNWVQLAGGSHADRMASEFRRLGQRSAALKKRGAAVTAGKDYFRLLTGPFATRADAQAFVNQLAKDGIEGFSWTRTPASLRIEKIPPK